jgi:tetratricopeptide (TPR) repeat protein
MSYDLVNLEQRALDLQNSGRHAEAATLFSLIVQVEPDWEHGAAWFNLAGCHEELGRLPLAEQCYREALRYEPESRDFLGGLASFLYLHGSPEEAFDAYLRALRADQVNRDEDGVARCVTALKALGQKLGWSETSVLERINAVLNSPRS